MADDQVKSWKEWNRKWQRTIIAQSPFEWNFAQKVIQKVSGLDPNHVTPQRSFIANDGRERHMDFAIEIDGIKIAIEVEGWDKTGENRGKNKREHDEFNRRIQSLTTQRWKVLTVTNTQFTRDPLQYIADINKIIFEEQTKLESKPTTEEEVQEVEEPKKPEQTPNEERNVKPLYALVGLAAIVVIGVVVWSLTRGSDNDVVMIEMPGDREQPEPEVSEEQPQPEVSEEEQESPIRTPSSSENQPSPPVESEVSELTYITKNRVDIRRYEDSQGDVDCGYLPEAAKPVWLSDPDIDPYNLDGWRGERGNAWACGIPTYLTTDFDWDFEKWEDATGDVNCGVIPEESKPIFLIDKENDPYELDGNGNKVDDGVACFP